jgi:hypothetical protein
LGAALADGLAAAVLPRGAVGLGAALPLGPGRGADPGVARGAVGFGVAAGLGEAGADGLACAGLAALVGALGDSAGAVRSAAGAA